VAAPKILPRPGGRGCAKNPAAPREAWLRQKSCRPKIHPVLTRFPLFLSFIIPYLFFSNTYFIEIH
jgi:hypothetical protein